jgi:hypothetical protein
VAIAVDCSIISALSAAVPRVILRGSLCESNRRCKGDRDYFVAPFGHFDIRTAENSELYGRIDDPCMDSCLMPT